MSYSLDHRINAKELFVEQSQTYEEVAGATGISVSVLKVWGKEGKWTEERAEFERDVLDIRARLRKTTIKKIKEIEQDPGDQKIHALMKLIDATFKGLGKAPGIDKAGYFLEIMHKLVVYIKEHDGEALRRLEPLIQGFAASVKETG